MLRFRRVLRFFGVIAAACVGMGAVGGILGEIDAVFGLGLYEAVFESAFRNVVVPIVGLVIFLALAKIWLPEMFQPTNQEKGILNDKSGDGSIDDQT